MSSFAKGETVVRLTTLYYEMEDAVEAAEATETFDEAEALLRKECDLCAGPLKIKEVHMTTRTVMLVCFGLILINKEYEKTAFLSFLQTIKLLSCDHECCLECARNYFTISLKDKASIGELVCPFCDEPKGLNLNENEDKAMEYFAKLVNNAEHESQQME